MTTIDALAQPAAQPEARPAVQEAGAWGNSAPLGLAAFAVTTFMLSMINAELIKAPITPVVFGVALMFGGLTQLIAGIIQFRIGNAFTGVLFSTFGAFWLSLYAIAEFFLKDVVGPTPLATVALRGQALGLFLYAFGIQRERPDGGDRRLPGPGRGGTGRVHRPRRAVRDHVQADGAPPLPAGQALTGRPDTALQEEIHHEPLRARV
jgi:hypothetical protein